MLVTTFSQIFFWVFVLTNIIFYALFLRKTFTSYRAADGKTKIVIKAVTSLVVWLIATLVIVAGSAAYFAGHTLESAEPQTVRLESAIFYLTSFIIGWILTGAAIVYLMSRQPKPKNYGSN